MKLIKKRNQNFFNSIMKSWGIYPCSRALCKATSLILNIKEKSFIFSSLFTKSLAIELFQFFAAINSPKKPPHLLNKQTITLNALWELSTDIFKQNLRSLMHGLEIIKRFGGNTSHLKKNEG